MTFEGFPVAALDFYDDLEMDNTKSFWEANKHIYLEAVRAPMLDRSSCKRQKPWNGISSTASVPLKTGCRTSMVSTPQQQTSAWA